MKKTSLFAATLALSGMFIFSSCEKFEGIVKEETKEESVESESFKEDATVTLTESNYEKEIETDLEKKEGCDHYTTGVIKYIKDGKELGKFDFGKGDNDSKGTFSYDDKKEDVDLDKKKDGYKHKFDKKITMPIIKTEDCDYPVEGIVEYYDENGTLVSTIDFGDGTCDDIATKTWEAGSHKGKTWEAGSKEFSLSEAKKKYNSKKDKK